MKLSKKENSTKGRKKIEKNRKKKRNEKEETREEKRRKKKEVEDENEEGDKCWRVYMPKCCDNNNLGEKTYLPNVNSLMYVQCVMFIVHWNSNSCKLHLATHLYASFVGTAVIVILICVSYTVVTFIIVIM